MAGQGSVPEEVGLIRLDKRAGGYLHSSPRPWVLHVCPFCDGSQTDPHLGSPRVGPAEVEGQVPGMPTWPCSPAQKADKPLLPGWLPHCLSAYSQLSRKLAHG